MTRSRILSMPTRGCWPLGSTAVLVVFVLMAPSTPAAQSPPPVKGTIALEGTMKKFYRAANVVIVTTIDRTSRGGRRKDIGQPGAGASKVLIYYSNEAGREFEPQDENPMVGFRGTSRYYDARYADGFALECAALRRARQALGLRNIKVRKIRPPLKEGEHHGPEHDRRTRVRI